MSSEYKKSHDIPPVKVMNIHGDYLHLSYFNLTRLYMEVKDIEQFISNILQFIDYLSNTNAHLQLYMCFEAIILEGKK